MGHANEAGWDRALRVVLGVVLLVVGFGVVGDTGGAVLGIVGLVPLLTGITGFCPLYALMHVRTHRGRPGATSPRQPRPRPHHAVRR